MRHVSILALLMPLPLLLVIPDVMSAQVVATSFEELRPLVKSGDTIYWFSVEF